MNPNARLFSLASGVVEEVEDLLVVQLHELRGHLKLWRRLSHLFGLFLSPLNPLKQLFDRPRDDPEGRGHRLGQLEARAHRVRLAGARLTVGQHGRIVPEMRKEKQLKKYVKNCSF